MARVVLQQSPINADKNLLYTPVKGCLWNVTYCTAVVLIYFVLSIGLTFYQRWFLQIFHHPLLVVECHLLLKFVMAALLRSVWHCWTWRPRVRIGWLNILRKIIPMSLASGLDIAFSNWGLGLITVSLYTMTKSTSIIFILFFAVLLKLEKKSWLLFVIVLMISGGLAMFTYKSTQFHLLGFLLVLFASFTSGLRWTLGQFLMQKSDLGLENPVDMLYHVQPWMCILILPVAITFEAHSWSGITTPVDWNWVLYIGSRILAGGVIALAMELTEYLVISKMSSLTLSVAGILKEICTLTLAVEWNGDEMSKLNAVGLLLCLGGIICHVAHKAILERDRQNLVTSQHKPLLDEASAHFLADMTASSEDEEGHDEDSSTEVLFSVLHSRDR